MHSNFHRYETYKNYLGNTDPYSGRKEEETEKQKRKMRTAWVPLRLGGQRSEVKTDKGRKKGRNWNERKRKEERCTKKQSIDRKHKRKDKKNWIGKKEKTETDKQSSSKEIKDDGFEAAKRNKGKEKMEEEKGKKDQKRRMTGKNSKMRNYIFKVGSSRKE